MNPSNNNTTQKPGVTSRFREALAQFIFGKNHPGHLPHIPQPGQTLPDPAAGMADDFTETKADIHSIYGTGIVFGTTEAVQVDEDGNGRELIQGQSYPIGTGRIVNKAEEVVGICPICKIDVLPQFQAGLISIQEAHLRAMYDVNSAARCDICGRNTCTMHCRPVKINEDVLSLCTICLEQVKKKERRQKILSWLLAPLTEPTPQKEEDRR